MSLWQHYEYLVTIQMPLSDPVTVKCNSIADVRKALGVSTETVSRLIHKPQNKKSHYTHKFSVTRSRLMKDNLIDNVDAIESI